MYNGVVLQDNVIHIATHVFSCGNELLAAPGRSRQSSIQKLDFGNPEEAAKRINKYIEDNTNKHVKDVLHEGDLDPDTSFIIVNAIHFKDQWEKPFEKAVDEEFFITPKQSKKVGMMHLRHFFHYKHDEKTKTKFLILNFRSAGMRMVIVLEDRPRENKLRESSVKKLLAPLSLPEVLVDVKLPKFIIQAEYDIKDILSKMGMEVMFDRKKRNLGIIGDNSSIAKLRQKTYIEVNEIGVETPKRKAAFARADSMSQLHHKEFFANRPFRFYLIVKESIAFYGQVVDPVE